MSERRMFSKSITESDAFLDLPFSAQALYFHLSMSADDEGFINNSKRVIRVCGASEEDLGKLIERAFLIRFESGIFVIKHWKINNKIRNDRKKDTNYPEEKALLVEKSTGVYSLKDFKEIAVEETAKTDSVVKENLTTESVEQEVLSNTEQLEYAEPDEKSEQIAYEATTEPRKGYAEAVFDILFSHNLPCCKGNLVSFTMRDFKLALGDITNLHLHSEDVIQAVKNYAEVIELKRKGLSWWNSEQTFYNFCNKKTILRFLPENFKIEDFMKQKESGNAPLEDKIQL